MKITIIGLGLIGSSIARALKATAKDYYIIGYSAREQTLQKAQELGIVDQTESQLEAAVSNTDIIILCTPLSAYGPLLTEMIDQVAEKTIITDVGSVKQSVHDVLTPIKSNAQE